LRRLFLIGLESSSAFTRQGHWFDPSTAHHSEASAEQGSRKFPGSLLLSEWLLFRLPSSRLVGISPIPQCSRVRAAFPKSVPVPPSIGQSTGVRRDAENINQQRIAANKARIHFEPFRGSGAVDNPGDEVVMGSGRTNADFFANLKAQNWWALRARFHATYRAVVEGLAVSA
jgi:hypothetical protein